VPDDPFVVVAGGRAFHLEGLVALSELVASLATARRSGKGRAARLV